MSQLKIGLQLPVVNTYSSGAVWGDEIMAVGLADALRGQPDVAECEVYGVDTIHDNLDLVISFYAHPDTRLVANVRNVWWYQAPRLEASRGVAETSAPQYEAILVASPMLGQRVRAHGAQRILFVPMSANPNVYHPRPPRDEFRHPIVFCANHNRTRAEVERFLLPLLPLGLAIYGAAWEREPELVAAGALHGPIHPSDVPALYSSCQLVLSCHTAWHRNQDMPTSRLWEATLCGAPILSDRVPTAETLFGETICFTDGGDDLVAKATALLADDTLRLAQAQAARERVQAGLTFEHHARRILDFLAEQ